MKIKCKYLFVLCFLFLQFHLFAEVSFGGLDLNYEDDLLFTAYQNIPGTYPYTSLLVANLGKKAVNKVPQMLTCFPESVELLNEGNNLQIRNRYGRALYNEKTDTLVWTSSADRIPVEYTHMGPQAVSPDGKWLCYVKRIKSSVGQLILQNTATTEERILVESTSFSYDGVNVKWAPDSSAVIYENKGYIYFATPSLSSMTLQLPEEYCKIGEGTIDSVNWTEDKCLIYIDGDIVYKIYENELYTRGLYSNMIGNGTIIGRLPSTFNSLRDKFWCDDYCNQIVIISAEKIITKYTLPSKGNENLIINNVIPLTALSGNLLDYQIFWTLDSKPVLWTDVLLFESGIKASSVYNMDGKLELILTVKGSLNPKLSPDRRHVAFTGGTSLYVYDTTTWKQTAKLTGEKIVSFVWKDKQSIYAGGCSTVKLWSFDAKATAAASIANKESIPSEGESKFLFLSSVASAFWNETEIIAYVAQSGKCYSYSPENNVWKERNSVVKVPSEPNLQNRKYRVFTDTANNKLYKNGVFVRSLSGKAVTYDLYTDTAKKIPAAKKCAIIIDAMDNAEGVAKILSELDDFNLKTTFFLNGEFIRRYPNETKQIAAKGHECASSFFTTADLTAENIVVKEDFIMRGLARNEDEFNILTGKELSLLWHAPYYHQTELMKNAGKEAGYAYVKPFTGYIDRVTLEMESENPAYLYLDAGNLIDAFVASLEDGMIIPVTAGKVHGTRQDYLYEKIDLLIAAILDHGYEITDIRSLIK